MKKKSVLLLSSIIASSVCSFATDYVYSPAAGNTIQTITPGWPISSAVLKLDENGTVATGTYGGGSDGCARFQIVGADAKSVNCIKGDASNAKEDFKGWDLIGNWAINIYNSANTEYTVLDFNEDVKIVSYGNSGTINIYNSLNPSASANGNFKKITFSNAYGKIRSELGTLRLNGDEIVFSGSDTALHVAKGTMEYNVAKTTWGEKTAYLQVDQGATFKMLTDGFTLNRAFISGDFVNETKNNLSIVANLSYQTEVTGSLFSKGRIRLENKSAATFAGDVSYLKSTSTSLLMYGSATLTLAAKDTLHALSLSTKEAYDAAADKSAFLVREEDGKTVYYQKETAIIVVANDNSNTINVDATNKFYLHYSGIKNASVNVASEATWVLTQFEGNGVTLNLGNFENDSLFILDEAKEKFDMIGAINAVAADGTTYTKEDLAYIAGTFEGMNGYWLTVAVPEPAEWAMILGGLALGLAIYRRRK